MGSRTPSILSALRRRPTLACTNELLFNSAGRDETHDSIDEPGSDGKAGIAVGCKVSRPVDRRRFENMIDPGQQDQLRAGPRLCRPLGVGDRGLHIVGALHDTIRTGCLSETSIAAG